MKAVDDAAKAHWANAEATLRSTLGELARSSQVAVVELQGASAMQVAQAREANEATARAMTEALAEALRRVLTNTALRKRMAEAAWAHGETLPRWSDTAAAVSEALWSALP